MSKINQKTIVISAINIHEGGALTILHDCLMAFNRVASSSVKVVFLISNRSILKDLKVDNIDFLEFPHARKRWINRIFYEYLFFFWLSKKIRPDIWFSLHDVTPWVDCKRRYVYCHNPSIFLDMPLKDSHLDFTQYIFSKFYSCVYKINLGKNSNVIVQQQWFANAFYERYGFDDLIVSSPDISYKGNSTEPAISKHDVNSQNYSIFYPAFPRYFKNHSILLEAAKICDDVDFYLTISGNENRYSQHLTTNKVNENVKLLGLISRNEVSNYYANVDALVFPSLLETWGLPITEAKDAGLDIIAADRNYCHEAVGDYQNVYWFDPLDIDDLVKSIDRARDLNTLPDGPKSLDKSYPVINGWDNLVNFICKE